MKTSVRRALGLAALSALVVGTLGCSAPGGGGTAKVESLSPPEGATSGGLSVTITGSNFEGGPASVYFDGEKATDVEVLSDTEIRCTIPPGEVGLANVEVRSSGNTGRKVGGFEYLPGVEAKEAPNLSGGNDTFAGYERIPIEFDFQGYIGEAGDVDVFHLHPPDGGKVFVSVDWSASFTSGGIAAIQVEFFQGPDPTPDPDAYFGGSIIGAHDGSGPPPAIVDWMRPSFVIAGSHGPYLRVTAFGDGNHAGFDPIRPYTIRIDYESDATFEPAPQADSFRNAIVIDPAAAPVSVTNGAAYDDDFDWYRFTVPNDGWARVVLDAQGLGTSTTSGEISVSAKLFWVDPSDPDGNHVFSVPDSEIFAVDLPGPTARVVEVTSLEALQTYVLRVTNTDNSPMAPYDYSLSVEYGAGGTEDDEPGVVPAAETQEDALDLGVVDMGSSPLIMSAYLFHDADRDWFKVTAPPGGGVVQVDWDHTDISSGGNGIGFYDAGSNPLGGEFNLFVFDQLWFTSSGLPAVGEALEYDGTPASDTKSVSVSMGSNENYYILVDTLHGWSTTDDYTLTLTLQ